MTSENAGNYQLDTWRGDFGDSYTDRNVADENALRARTKMWAQMLRSIEGELPSSILEIGANLGLNMRTLKRLTEAELFALEPNAKARQILLDEGVMEPQNLFDAYASAIPMEDRSVDMAFTSGVLIHVPPNDLLASCTEMHRVSRKYIVCAEYFSVAPQELKYRGHNGLLFKRDFGDFWMSSFPDLKLRDYGFFWKRATGLDNLTWWVFEKGE